VVQITARLIQEDRKITAHTTACRKKTTAQVVTHGTEYCVQQFLATKATAEGVPSDVGVPAQQRHVQQRRHVDVSTFSSRRILPATAAVSNVQAFSVTATRRNPAAPEQTATAGRHQLPDAASRQDLDL